VVVSAAAARDSQKPRGLRETVPPPDQCQQPPLDFGDGGGDPVQELTRLEFRQRLRRPRLGRRVERAPFSSVLTKTPSPVPKDEIPGDRGEPGHGDDQRRRPLSQQPQPDVLGDVIRLGLSEARVDATRQDPGIGFRDPRLRFATGSEADLPPRIARGRPPHHSLRPRVSAGFFLSPSARSILKSEMPCLERPSPTRWDEPKPPRLRIAKIINRLEIPPCHPESSPLPPEPPPLPVTPSDLSSEASAKEEARDLLPLLRLAVSAQGRLRGGSA